MAANPPVPRVVKAADTQALLALEDAAANLGFSQRLLPAWLKENVAATGLHYLVAWFVAQALPSLGGVAAIAV